MSDIPEQVIKEILFRLPVKSLLKFRCVCHSWLSLIDSPFFIKTQLSCANTTPKIILCGSSPYVLNIDTLNPKPTAKSSVLDLSYPPKTSVLPTDIKGSCNGILLTFHSRDDWDVALQNPSTKRFCKIPYGDCIYSRPQNVGPEKNIYSPDKVVYGLGYDHLNDDFKVLRNVQFSADFGNGFYSVVDIYSLKMNSWRNVHTFPYFVKHVASNGVFVGGALHWVVSTSVVDPSQLIAAFDLSIEEYKLVHQPVYPSGDFELNVYVLGECLFALYDYISMGCFDLWVMKEYGELESWSKVFYVRVADIGVDFRGYMRPLFYSECRKKVLLERDFKTLAWYDLENKSVESVEIGGCQMPQEFTSIILLESLAKLDCHGRGNVERRGAQKNVEKSNKKREKRDNFLSKGFKLNLQVLGGGN